MYRPIQLFVHLWVTYGNSVSYPWSLAINPEYQYKFNYPSIQCQKYSHSYPIPFFQEYQCHNNIVPFFSYCYPIPPHNTESDKPILGQCEVYLLNHLFHSWPNLRLWLPILVREVVHTSHLYYLFTSWHFLVYHSNNLA